MNSIQTSFVGTSFNYLLGPTCVAKGFLLKLLWRALVKQKEAGLRIGIISFGQIIRDLMKENARFAKTYGPIVAGGDLLDDAVAIELFNGKLLELHQEGPFDMMLVDGFARTVPQIHYADGLNLLRPQDNVFVINATHDVCSRRFTHRNENDPGRLEREMATFTKRYHLHADNVENLKAALSATGVRDNVIEIDANNRDPDGHPVHDCHPTMGITEYAFPAFMSHLIPVISGIMTRRPSETEHSEVHGS